MVKFVPLNLLDDFSQLGRFDVVFCRNVLIYFDQATKISVLDRIANITERDGFLVLGGAETVVGLTDRFKPIPDKRGLYRPAGGMTSAGDQRHPASTPPPASRCHRRRTLTARCRPAIARWACATLLRMAAAE